MTMPEGNRRPSLLSSTVTSSNGGGEEFRVSKNPNVMKYQRMEAFCYNHGMGIAFYVLFIALNVLVGGHGAYQFTPMGGFATDNQLLKYTLPIARAGGRLVTLNCAILLLTACKYFWTIIRKHMLPVIPIGLPIDDIMPKYHRVVALWIIVCGCIIHTIPQIVNYATTCIIIETSFRFWTFGNNGFATLQLLVTGTLLFIIFSTFYITTLPSFRKTAVGFRWFWTFHIVGIATVYPLLILHGTNNGSPIFLYVQLIPLCIYIIDIIMRRITTSVTTHVIDWKIHNSNDNNNNSNNEHQQQQITELILKCPPNFTFTPGQYVDLKIPIISKYEWHPFTIASAPRYIDKRDRDRNTSNIINSTTECEDEDEELVFYMKAVGRWTNAVYDCFSKLESRRDVAVHIRGPHGAAAMNYFEYKHIILIGSGVGVTPLLAIWKYLKSISIKARMSTTSTTLEGEKNENSNRSYDSIDNINNSNNNKSSCCISKIGSMSFVAEKYLMSMAVSLCLLSFFVFGETLVIIMQMFCNISNNTDTISSANVLRAVLSLLALLIHGCIVIVSSLSDEENGNGDSSGNGSDYHCTSSQRCCNYFRQGKCWLEWCIIIVSTCSLWAAVKWIGGGEEENDEGVGRVVNAVLSGAIVMLHAIRIFHLFHHDRKSATKTTSNSSGRSYKKSNSKSYDLTKGMLMEYIADSYRRKTLTSSSGSSRKAFHKNRTISKKGSDDEDQKNKDDCSKQIYSIKGIMVNKYHAEMSFATKEVRRTLQYLPSSRNITQSQKFTMEFYGTQEKERCNDQVEVKRRTIQRAPSSFLEPGQFRCGRPNWYTILLDSISTAHHHPTTGGCSSVGVFFCGSPAIAHELTINAAKVTAQHHYSIKCLEGKICNCKLIVHCENF